MWDTPPGDILVSFWLSGAGGTLGLERFILLLVVWHRRDALELAVATHHSFAAALRGVALRQRQVKTIIQRQVKTIILGKRAQTIGKGPM